MTIARRDQLRPEVTPYYHCITRCVRRAFLCGRDRESGKRFSHRKKWIETHLLLLSRVFCIDIAGYAVMSNHYHLVLHINQAEAQKLTDSNVQERWFRLYKGPEIMQRYARGEELSEEEIETVAGITATWRQELTNISRFMGHLNQTIARRANKEDGCKGRFWESRFKLQAILDTKALLRTLCYVDLNPIRAGIAETPESSRFTSVKRRITKVKSGLMRFHAVQGNASVPDLDTEPLPISFDEYLALLDYTGREIRPGKVGHIGTEAPPILDRIGYDKRTWDLAQKSNGRWLSRAVGSSESLKRYCEAFGLKWTWCVSA